MLHVRNEAPIRLIRRLLFVTLVIGICFGGFGYWSATREPEVRETRVAVRDWPRGERPLRLLLASDIHVQGPDMPPERLARIVEQINALAPDAVLIAGDFIGDKQVATRDYSYAEALAPLAGLRSRLGTFAVLGNHDHWKDAAGARRVLAANRVHVLTNESVRVGPLALGGLDDDFTGHADLGRTLVAMQVAGGVPVLLSHSPDPFPDLPVDVPLMLAGHTHCGQVRLPILGALQTMSRYGKRYACGRVDERGRTLIVTAGLGTSGLPIRTGAVPDLWLIEIGPAAPQR